MISSKAARYTALSGKRACAALRLSRKEAVKNAPLIGLTADEAEHIYEHLFLQSSCRLKAGSVNESVFLDTANRFRLGKNVSWASPESDFTAVRRNELPADTKKYDMSSLSWASPESDFTAARSNELPADTKKYDMSSLSWASPESDFTAALRNELPADAKKYDMSSLSWASPESDFTAARRNELPADTKKYDMSSLSWASPESDFTAARRNELPADAKKYDMSSLSWASPESDFTAQGPSELGGFNIMSTLKDLFLYYPTGLSFASPDSDFTSQMLTPPISVFSAFEEQRSQYLAGQKSAAFAETIPVHTDSISFSSPESDFVASMIAPASATAESPAELYIDRTLNEITLVEAMAPSVEARVLTRAEAPFEICHVNAAWESLCGFTNEEATGKTLELIQNEATNPSDLASLLSSLELGRASETLLTNVDRHGRHFQNHLKVKPVLDPATGQLTHFLGILKDVGDAENTYLGEEEQMMAA